MRVMAGDIGGTKTLLHIADVFPNSFNVVFEKKFDSHSYDDFSLLLKDFIKEAASQADMVISSACFGVAGPVKDNVADITNLPWFIDGAKISKETGIPRVRLINDFQAVGYGLEFLQEDDIETLQEGVEESQGPRVIIGAGTGLGEGVMYWQQDHYEIIPSEGGHSDFAPVDSVQMELLRYMLKQHDRVSYEQVISGKGLVNIFSYLRSIEPGPVSHELNTALQNDDNAAAISHFALQENDALAKKALSLFCKIYGAQTGNLALTCLATGGVYIAGGVAAKIITEIKAGGFMQAFCDKGKMSGLLENMPVKVVMNPKVGLIGAAYAATRLK